MDSATKHSIMALITAVMSSVRKNMDSLPKAGNRKIPPGSNVEWDAQNFKSTTTYFIQEGPPYMALSKSVNPDIRSETVKDILKYIRRDGIDHNIFPTCNVAEIINERDESCSRLRGSGGSLLRGSGGSRLRGSGGKFHGSLTLKNLSLFCFWYTISVVEKGGGCGKIFLEEYNGEKAMFRFKKFGYEGPFTGDED